MNVILLTSPNSPNKLRFVPQNICSYGYIKKSGQYAYRTVVYTTDGKCWDVLETPEEVDVVINQFYSGMESVSEEFIRGGY